MISPTLIKLIEYLPETLVENLSRKILKRYLRKYADIDIQGMENLKQIERPTIFISNHLSNSDALVINNILKQENMTFIAGIKLSTTPLTKLGLSITKTIFIKPNTADKKAITNIVSTVKKGNSIFIFPEGTRSRNGEMIEAKKGILLIQKLTKAKIVPIGLSGTEKLLPINDKNMGEEKFNYAKVRISIGKQFDIPKKNKEENKQQYEERALEYIMKKISELLPKNYRGVYR